LRVLVVEDDPMISDGVGVGLRLAGFTVDTVATCADAQASLAASSFDAVLLDVMLPDGSGLDVLRALRSANDRTPVLLLTALDRVSDRVRGLDTGADDYLGKPFDLDELAARVRAIARRSVGRASSALTVGDVTLDPATMIAVVDGKSVPLSQRECSVLSALMERPGTIRSKRQLEERLYGWQEDIESNTIEVHVHNLRAKIGRATIETVRGSGYRMRTSP